jgi:hypothetical protein
MDQMIYKHRRMLSNKLKRCTIHLQYSAAHSYLHIQEVRVDTRLVAVRSKVVCLQSPFQEGTRQHHPQLRHLRCYCQLKPEWV